MKRIVILLAAITVLMAGRVRSAILYADVNSTNPASPYADLATAAVTIQDAIDAATNGDTVLVNDGVYQTGTRVTKDGFSPVAVTQTNRLVVGKRITVQSLNGPSVTVIDGRGIYRCVLLTNRAVLNGFTLTNGSAGYTYTNPVGGYVASISNDGGAACGPGFTFLAEAVVSNCVLTGSRATGGGGGAANVTLLACSLIGNGAGDGGGAVNSILVDCRVLSNHTPHTAATIPGIPNFGPTHSGGGVYHGSAYNCLIAGNSAWIGGGCDGARLFNCTIVNNFAGFDGGVASSSAMATNCIIYFNQAGTNNNFDTSSSLNYCSTFPRPASGMGNMTNDPVFVDWANGDFHLASNSPAINAGNNTFVKTATDLEGHSRIAGGTVDLGAFEQPSPRSMLPLLWAQQFGLAPDGSADYQDADGDGMGNWQEFVAGTNPTNAASVLAMSAATYNKSLHWMFVTWQSVNTRTYFLERSTDLAAQPVYSFIQSNIVGSSGTTTYFDTTATNGGPYYYRVGVQ